LARSLLNTFAENTSAAWNQWRVPGGLHPIAGRLKGLTKAYGLSARSAGADGELYGLDFAELD
jgi:hypothetical protein